MTRVSTIDVAGALCWYGGTSLYYKVGFKLDVTTVSYRQEFNQAYFLVLPPRVLAAVDASI